MATNYGGVVFRRTKGAFNDFDSEAWDDDALTKAYDIAVSKLEDVEMSASESLRSIPASVSEESESAEPTVGEVVWSRTPGVTINQQNNKRNSKNTKRNRKRKSKQNLEYFNGGTAPDTGNWKVGDDCMAMYYTDGLYYSATIQSTSEENCTARVAFTDYPDEDETVNLRDIHPKHLWEDAGIDLSQNPRTVETPEPDDSDEDSIETEDAVTSMSDVADCSTTPSSRKNRKSQRPPFDVSAPLPHPRHSASCIPPPPPPFMPMPSTHFSGTSPFFSSAGHCCNVQNMSKEALSNMLASWYMAGYHTGFYRGLVSPNKHKCKSRKKTPQS